jgi:hypothetical protein
MRGRDPRPSFREQIEPTSTYKTWLNKRKNGVPVSVKDSQRRRRREGIMNQNFSNDAGPGKKGR